MNPPDYVLIPYQLLADKDLTPLDKFVYGFIYWLTKLKQDKCIASNGTLAELCGVNTGSVKNSLTRLENKKYIKRIFSDTEHRIRDEIIPLVAFSQVASTNARGSSNNATPRHQPMTPPSSNNAQNNKSINKKSIKNILGSEIEKSDSRNPEIQELWEYGTSLGFTDTRQKLQRFSLNRLLSKHTALQLRRAAEFSASIKQDRYAPQVNSWIDLEDKYLKLRDYVARQQQKQTKTINLDNL